MALHHITKFTKEWTVHGILAVAVNPSWTKAAVAKENGHLEILDIPSLTLSNVIVMNNMPNSPYKPASPKVQQPEDLASPINFFHVRTIVWPSNKSIITGGLDGVLRMWDVETGALLKSEISGGGPVWSMALNPLDGRLAVACDSGQVRIFTSKFHLAGILKGTLKSKMLSVCWALSTSSAPPGGARGSGGNSCEVWGGNVNGEVFGWTVVKSLAERLPQITMRLPQKGAFPWSIAYSTSFGHNQLITGDSGGNMIVWDTNTCTQIQRVTRHTPNTDITCLAIDPSQSVLFSAGADGMIHMFYKDEGGGEGGQASTGVWEWNGKNVEHVHDVWGLAIVKGKAGLSTLSGGPDGCLISTKQRIFKVPKALVRSYWVYPLPQVPVCSVGGSSKASLLLYRTHDALHIYRLATKERTRQPLGAHSESDTESYNDDYTNDNGNSNNNGNNNSKYNKRNSGSGPKRVAPYFLLKISPNMQREIVAAEISRNGSYIGASDGHRTKVWSTSGILKGKLNYLNPSSTNTTAATTGVKRSRSESSPPPVALPGATKIAFVGSRLLLLAETGTSLLHCYSLPDLVLQGVWDSHLTPQTDESGPPTITTLKVSPNADWIVIGDCSANMHFYSCNINNDNNHNNNNNNNNNDNNNHNDNNKSPKRRKKKGSNNSKKVVEMEMEIGSDNNNNNNHNDNNSDIITYSHKQPSLDNLPNVVEFFCVEGWWALCLVSRDNSVWYYNPATRKLLSKGIASSAQGLAAGPIVGMLTDRKRLYFYTQTQLFIFNAHSGDLETNVRSPLIFFGAAIPTESEEAEGGKKGDADDVVLIEMPWTKLCCGMPMIVQKHKMATSK